MCDCTQAKFLRQLIRRRFSNVDAIPCYKIPTIFLVIQCYFRYIMANSLLNSFSCSLNVIFGNVTNDKLRYKVAVNQYGWERISKYCQRSSTWDLCWRNGRGGDWFIPSSKWPSIQSSCFSSWLLLFYWLQELSSDHNLLLSLPNIRSHFLSQ